MTLEDACRAGSFSVVEVTEGLDGVRHSARQLGETIMTTRLFNNPRLPAVLQPGFVAEGDPRFQLNRAAPSQIKPIAELKRRAFTTALPTDPRLNLGIVKSNDPRLRRAFEAIWVWLRQDGLTWADCFQEQFPQA